MKMTKRMAVSGLILFTLQSLLCISGMWGAITPAGDIDPSPDAEFWTTLEDVDFAFIDIGTNAAMDEGNGNLTIDDGSILAGEYLYLSLGYYANSYGALILTGAGTELSAASIELGGTGLFSVENGYGFLKLANGAILNAADLSIGDSELNNVELDEGTLNADFIYGGDASDFTGTGVINTQYIDGKGYYFIFDDSATNTSTTVIDNGRGDEITLTLTPTIHGPVNEPMTVSNGVQLNLPNFHVGKYEGETAVTTVTGAGTKITSHSNPIRVGDEGDGTLIITDGAEVNNTSRSGIYVGREGDSNGRIFCRRRRDLRHRRDQCDRLGRGRLLLRV